MNLLEIEWDNLDLRNIGRWPVLFRSVLVLLACGLGLWLGEGLFLEDLWIEHQDLKRERLKKQNDFENTVHQADHLQTYRLQVQEVKRALEKALQQLPCQSEQANLLEWMSEQASLQGLQFRGIKPEAPVIKEFYREQPIECALLGGFHGLGEFVSQLANMPRIVTIHDFSLRKDKNSTQVDILLTAKTYWALDAEQDPHE